MCDTTYAGLCAWWPGPILAAIAVLAFLCLVGALALTILRRAPTSAELLVTISTTLWVVIGTALITLLVVSLRAGQ